MINNLKHNSIIDLLGSIIVKNMLRARCNGELGELTKSINEHRSRPLANPRSDRERFRDGPPEFSSLDALRVLWHARSHRADLDRTMALLADEPSRELLRRILAYRALGPRYVNLPSDTDNPLESQPQATACMVGPGDDPAFGTQLYRMGDITIEAWPLNIWADFFEQQYVFERDGIRIAVEPGDSVLDLGACFGDTSLTFAAAAGETGRVDAFEPMPRQVEVIERNLARNPALASRVHVHRLAVFDRRVELLFADGGAAAHPSHAGTIKVPTCRLDDWIRETGVVPTFIKMDVEGAESAALRGSADTIRRYRPKLAISAYHSLADLTGLAPLIASIQPDYRFYLDHHTTHAEETVLYAIC
ncbi:FkbM family methyltransferase [Sphingomonas ursincola]|uniref:FkbM family methyltransferase n=2 Tax=Sphingomonas ursincola TaxID=56361 RepID=A0A7V8RF48_9SPHN|nr:FkbM family methyltransferase [Sphingomonas ursincola]